MICIWNFGLHEHARDVIRREKLVHLQNLILVRNGEIRQVVQGKKYKYLGTEKAEGIQSVYK